MPTYGALIGFVFIMCTYARDWGCLCVGEGTVQATDSNRQQLLATDRRQFNTIHGHAGARLGANRGKIGARASIMGKA